MGAVVDIDRNYAGDGGPSARRRWQRLGVLTAAVVLDGLVASIGAAGDAIQHDLDVPDALMPEVLYGYGLVFLLALLPAGRLADLYGYRRVFLVGAVTFTVASALCGLAPTVPLLAGGRLLQGVAGAAMIPQVLTAVMTEFAPDERRHRIAGYAVYGVVVAFIAPSTGVLLEGLIRIDLFGLGWRPLFLGTAALAAVMVATAVRVLPAGRPPAPPRYDRLGTAVLVVALLLLVYPLSVGAALGWPVWTLVTVAASVPAFGLFAAYEVRRSRRDGSALVVAGLFRDRTYGGGLVVIVVMSFAILGFFPFFASYLNTGLGFSLGQVWLASLAWPIGITIASAVDVWFAARIGRGVLIAGMAVMTVSVAMLIPVFHESGAAVTWQQIAPALFVAGLGKGIMTPALIDAVLARVPRPASGSASGTLLLVQQVGGNVGFAVLGAVLVGVLAGQAGSVPVTAVTAAVRAEAVPAAADAEVVAGFQQCLRDRITQSVAAATPAACSAAEQSATAATGSAAAGERLRTAVTGAADTARRSGVAQAIERGLWYEVAMLAVSTVLLLLLPSGNPRRRRQVIEPSTTSPSVG